MSKSEAADELRYLLQLVRDVESNDKAHAVTTLTARKSSLVSLADTTTEETTADTTADTAETTEEDTSDWTMEQY